jgi:polyisoprenoid-binding protein YceI
MQTNPALETWTHTPQSSPPPGLAGSWRVDPEASKAHFTAGNLAGLMSVSGRFRSLAGSLSVGERNVRGMLRINAATIDTGNRLRDRHLRSSDFLAAAKHRELRYEAERLDVDGAAVRIDGELIVAGTRSRLPLTAELHLHDEDAIVIACHARVDRVALGVRGARGVVSRMVDLDIAVTLRRLDS